MLAMMNQVLRQIIPFAAIPKVNRALLEKCEEQLDTELPNDMEGIEFDAFDKAYDRTVRVKERLEDKAKTILAALTISVTLILNLPNYMETILGGLKCPAMRIFSYVFAILAMVYMLGGGMMSISCLVEYNKISQVPIDKFQDKTAIYQCIQYNITMNIIRNNVIFAAYLSIRNSAICLSVIFFLAVLLACI